MFVIVEYLNRLRHAATGKSQYLAFVKCDVGPRAPAYEWIRRSARGERNAGSRCRGSCWYGDRIGCGADIGILYRDGVRTWRKPGEGIGRRLCGVGAVIDVHLIRRSAATECGCDGSLSAGATSRHAKTQC